MPYIHKRTYLYTNNIINCNENQSPDHPLVPSLWEHLRYSWYYVDQYITNTFHSSCFTELYGSNTRLFSRIGNANHPSYLPHWQRLFGLLLMAGTYKVTSSSLSSAFWNFCFFIVDDTYELLLTVGIVGVYWITVFFIVVLRFMVRNKCYTICCLFLNARNCLFVGVYFMNQTKSLGRQCKFIDTLILVWCEIYSSKQCG